jgi:hypothetical protein
VRRSRTKALISSHSFDQPCDAAFTARRPEHCLLSAQARSEERHTGSQNYTSGLPTADASLDPDLLGGRYLIEGKAVSQLKAQLALAALTELRAGERKAAAKLLMGSVAR